MTHRALKIALCTHSVNPRGGVVHTLELGRALHALQQDVTIFAPAADGEAMFRASPCHIVLARVRRTAGGIVSGVRARIDALKHALLAHDARAFDVVHAQDSISGNALAELKDDGAIRGFLRTVHHLDYFADPQLDHWQRRAWRDADRVLCVSEMWSRRMREDFRVDATSVTNGVDVERYRATGATDDCALRQRLGIAGAPIVLAVGGIEERKNTLTLLDAFALLRKTCPAAQLVIAGGASLLDHDAYTRRFVERAAVHGLLIGPADPVVVTGPLDDAVMPGLFRCADVVSMVSQREGFGLVVLEALASGKPVVVSDIAPFNEYLDAKLCCWAQPNDPASIAQALARALHARGGIDFDHAVPMLLRRFNWSASAQRHVDLYRQWLAIQPHPGCVRV
jgi:glycosyltransferase-like protein